MSKWGFDKGLQQVADGVWGYILPDGSWGWSNAGLVVDGGESLLVDTLFDLKLTDEMLKTMRDAVPETKRIGTLVNTHINGDHTFGNQLVEGARIITTKETGEAMLHEDPAMMQALIHDSPPDTEGARFLKEVFGPFDFRGIELPPVTDTFEGSLELKVGSKTVNLVDVGPAHTSSDVIAHVPDDKVVFTGDILFVGGHPAIWAGPVQNWVKACDLILDWDVDTIVPGHGPICGKAEVRAFRDYLIYIEEEARKRYEAGMSFEEAANDIDLGPFEHWGDSERMVPNVMTVYRHLGASIPEDLQPLQVFDMMARYRSRRRERAGCATAQCTNPAHRH